MGAWGIEPFDNDDAADFLGDLEDGQPIDVLTAALDLEGDEIDAPDASVALAAAAVVAVTRGGETIEGVGEDETGRIAALGLSPSAIDPLVPAALAALDRIQADGSELLELWDEVGQADEWRATIAPVRAALSA